MSLDTTVILFELVVLVFAFSIHEAAHAWMASRLGDPTARMLGRVTLNPIKHIDPVGSIIFPLLAAFSHFPLIGWAKPTPVTPRNFTRYKRDWALVTIAGPVSNLLTAIVCLLVLVFVKHFVKGGWQAIQVAYLTSNRVPVPFESGSLLGPLTLLLYSGITINILLFVFNLIPLPPLDGSRIVELYLPPGAARIYERISGFSMLILMGLAWFGVLGAILWPPIGFFNTLLNVL